MNILKHTSTWIWVGFLLVLSGVLLYSMGRIPYCSCGYIKLWHGVTWSSENSQHLSDWYTFSHIIHGFLLYWLLRRLFSRFSTGWLLVIATAIEAGWELFENTDMIINRYRAVTVSLDYYGDSIINSIADIIACIAGFELAHRSKFYVILTVLICFELLTLFVIRDNLTLNILMLMYPVPAIRMWQAG